MELVIMKSFDEVCEAIEKVLKTPIVLPNVKERREQLRKQRELVEKQEEAYKPNRKQLQKQFTI